MLLVLYFYIFVTQQPNSGLSRLIFMLLDHTQLDTRTSSRTLLNGRSPRYTGRYVHNTQPNNRQTYMPSAGFEHAIPPIKRLQTNALYLNGPGVDRILNYLH
jgi:hypothetical protein